MGCASSSAVSKSDGVETTAPHAFEEDPLHTGRSPPGAPQPTVEELEAFDNFVTMWESSRRVSTGHLADEPQVDVTPRHPCSGGTALDAEADAGDCLPHQSPQPESLEAMDQSRRTVKAWLACSDRDHPLLLPDPRSHEHTALARGLAGYRSPEPPASGDLTPKSASAHDEGLSDAVAHCRSAAMAASVRRFRATSRAAAVNATSGENDVHAGLKRPCVDDPSVSYSHGGRSQTMSGGPGRTHSTTLTMPRIASGLSGSGPNPLCLKDDHRGVSA